jgi:hypothetical protein
MLTKEKIIESIKELPDSFSMEEFFERIILIEKIEKGMSDSTKGKVISDESLNNHLPLWLQ